MKKNAIGNIYSCFNKDGKLKNQKMFTAEVHKLISDGDFNTAFDFIITSKLSEEIEILHKKEISIDAKAKLSI